MTGIVYANQDPLFVLASVNCSVETPFGQNGLYQVCYDETVNSLWYAISGNFLPFTVPTTTNLQVNSLGVGVPTDAVTGDALIANGLNVGPTSTFVNPTAGNVVIDNAFTCNNAGVATGVPCLNINSGAGYTGQEFGLDNVGNFLIGLGGALGSPPIILNTSTSGSIQFKSGATFQSTFVISTGLGNSARLISGSVLTMTGGTLPTLTTCNGAGSSITATSTPNRGQFTTQTAGCSTATVHFTQTMPQKMFCVCGDGNATITPVACSYDYPGSSTTQAVFDFANAGAAYKYDYVCE